LERFEVVFTKVAIKDLEKFNPAAKLKILEEIRELQKYPFPKGTIIKKLKSTKVPLYRLRTGDFRVIYHIDGKKIAVLFIVNRKDLERKLKSFF